MRVSCVILYTNLPIFFKQGLFSRKRQCRLWLFDETNKTDPLIGIFITALSIFWYQILILFCYFQEKRIQFETNLNSIKDKGKELIDKTKDKGHELLHRWEERSKDFIGNFLEMFGRDGRLVRDLKKSIIFTTDSMISNGGRYRLLKPNFPLTSDVLLIRVVQGNCRQARLGRCLIYTNKYLIWDHYFRCYYIIIHICNFFFLQKILLKSDCLIINVDCFTKIWKKKTNRRSQNCQRPSDWMSKWSFCY